MSRGSDTSAFRSIAKTNALFGGVQVFTILISIIRSKIIALLLGPSGMGIMGMFNSIVDLIRSLTNCGLQTSAIRDVSLANEENNTHKIAVLNKVLSRITWFTGSFGAIIMLSLAPQFSKFSFGSFQYTNHIRVLSIVILLSQLTSGKNILLQGLRQLKKLALANIIGSICGLLLTIPLYYYFGAEAIVPAIILSALISLFIATYFTKSINISSVALSWNNTFRNAGNMIKMGFLISITGILDMAVIYVVKNLIQNIGSISEVGLYTAGFAVVQSYVGLVFNSISTDYYPRLIAASSNYDRCQDLINKQFELMILFLTPLILLFIMFSKLLLFILYSSDFYDINYMIGWIAFGMIFRAYSWCLGFLYLAKNDSVLYLSIYIITAIVQIVIYWGLYKLFGLSGIGVGFVLLNLFSSILTTLIVKNKYGIGYSRISKIMLLFISFLTLLTMLLSYIDHWIKYILQAIISVSLYWYCFVQLNRRLDIKTFLLRFKR